MATGQGQPAKVLLIDDSEENITLLQELLKREGYEVASANDGLSGLEKVRSFNPDLILSDVMMPGLNGFQLTQRIRADSALSFIPIILITARNDNNDKIRALEAGADDFLVKPIQRLELVARARSLIRLKRSSDELSEKAKENARLYGEADQRATELKILNDISLGISSQIGLDELLQLITVKSCELVKAQSGIMYLSYEEEGKLVVRAQHNITRDYKGRSIAFGEGVGGLAALTRRPMRINNYFEWSGKASTFADDNSITAVLGMPLIANKRVVGVIEIMDDWRNHIFTDEDVRLLDMLAPQAAIAVSNALLYGEVSSQRDQLQAVLDSVNDGILMLDRNYNVVLANPRFTEFLRLPASQVLHQGIDEVADMLGEELESDPPFSSNTMRRILRDLQRNPSKGFQRKVTISDPKRRDLEWIGYPVLGEADSIIGWLNVFHDITGERELEQTRTEFIDMLVHDLRSPLTGVVGGISMVNELFPSELNADQQQQQVFIEMAGTNCQRLLTMINSLLEVSRMEAGKLPLNLQETTVTNLVKGSVDQTLLNAQEKQITLETEIDNGGIIISVDEDKMQRLIVNLLTNAIKFSPEGLDIKVAARVEEGIRRRGTTSNLNVDRLRQTTTQFLRERTREAEAAPKALLISVSDSGPGIPPHALDKVFDKFYQVEDKKSTQEGGGNGRPRIKGRTGVGLGLAFCKQVAEAHGGRIWAENNYGRGSTFYVSIPCVVETPALPGK